MTFALLRTELGEALEPGHQARAYRKDRPPSSILFATDGRGVVQLLEHIGPDADYIMEDSLTQQILIDDDLARHQFPGIWVWEGRVRGWRDYYGEYDEEFVGDVRPLREEEREALKRNDACFDPTLWYVLEEGKS